MKYVQGNPRSQTLLLPACVDDYVDPANVVRFIEAFVDSLDLAAVGFERPLPKAIPFIAEQGRLDPSFHASQLDDPLPHLARHGRLWRADERFCGADVAEV